MKGGVFGMVMDRSLSAILGKPKFNRAIEFLNILARSSQTMQRNSLVIACQNVPITSIHSGGST